MSHPTVLLSSRPSLPYVEIVIKPRRSGLPSRVVGDGLVVIDERLPLPSVLAGDKHPVPSVPAVNGCIPAYGRVGWGEGLLLVAGVDEVLLPPELFVCGDVPLLVSVDREGIVLSALVDVERDRSPALNSNGSIP